MAWLLLLVVLGIGYAALCALYAPLGSRRFSYDAREIRRHAAGREQQRREYEARCCEADNP